MYANNDVQILNLQFARERRDLPAILQQVMQHMPRHTFSFLADDTDQVQFQNAFFLSSHFLVDLF